MACGGYFCFKNVLACLNVLYILISIVLIGVAAYARLETIITNLTLVSSIIACGVFLLIVAIIGFIGAIKHHQVLLFFYMIILFVLFLLQFSLACACLSVNREQQKAIIKSAWKAATEHEKKVVQKGLDCCGFLDAFSFDNDSLSHPSCHMLNCCKKSNASCCLDKTPQIITRITSCPCQTCWKKIEPKTDAAFKITGGVGLFFSFTEIFGVWITVRFRNQKDPRNSPNAFL